jgi:hypothetical protein
MYSQTQCRNEVANPIIILHVIIPYPYPLQDDHSGSSDKSQNSPCPTQKNSKIPIDPICSSLGIVSEWSIPRHSHCSCHNNQSTICRVGICNSRHVVIAIAIIVRLIIAT